MKFNYGNNVESVRTFYLPHDRIIKTDALYSETSEKRLV